MASAQITITITDTAQHPLTEIRDVLTAKWGGPTGGTSQQKITFIQGYIAQHIKDQFKQGIADNAVPPDNSIDIQ